ncbi:hypothetical protein COCSUDRAFT_63601 [Coccomyxa subellipsoidea C-169]|uniref:Mediator of RNA polymerase II transcription subunit 14 n=1 Tax=Coccomyxa subellipsoidea (strain C-169) TaxID=574566 RepID=I0YXX6_COCSC|nr:hypothetical protein COCSUDRAFT_63601 [Coccomyxa subellipsoidea C-169]EIE23245.1 hypothetical protein COCSUDRAFT_63601 [Coccomyxa subellipsoidea C-169]|eukprot:XP_005647789.1 hypothetical protein COCSUDRAFT_63601 [Coccomyxa subellipsoidea C-169]
MGDQAALSGGLRLIDVRQILDVFLEQTDSHLRDLSANLGAQGDEDRKRALLLFLHNTKQRLLRLLIVVKWANKARVVAEVGRILDVAARQANACRDAADQLAYLHGELEDTRVPAYDVPTALEELRPPPAPPPAVRRARLRLMDQILRSTLLQEKLPAGVTVASVGGGVTKLRCGDLWEARLTLDASAGGAEGEPVTSHDEPQKATGADSASKHASASEPQNADAEPMEVDGQQALNSAMEAEVAGASEESDGGRVQPGGVLDERFRWRVLSAKALPQFTVTALMAPQQSSQLQGAIEMRMWAALDAAEEVERREGPQKESASEKPESGSTEQGPSGSSLPGVKAETNAKPEAAGKSSAAQDMPRQAPLEILHGVLRDVGSRLVLNQAVIWARSATKGPNGRWAKLLRIEPAKTLSLGIRICYWLNVPTVTPEDLRRLQQPESAPPLPKPTQQPQQHTPPAIEIGVAKSGEPSIVARPELVHVIHSVAVRAAGAAVALSMDLASLDAEQVLLRAAQANAAIQLAAIEALLQRSGNLQANNGAIALQPPAADGVASGALPSPVLELSCDGEPLLSVSVQLRTGLLLLHSGDGGSGGFFSNLGQELAPLLRQEGERLAALQAEALKQVPAEGLGTVGAAAADRLARSIESLWLNLSVRSRYSQLLSAAQSLGLHRAQIPPALLKAYAASNPLARLPAKNVLVLAFPPAPPMPSPPDTLAGAEGASRQDRLLRLLGKGGAGVQLYLQAEMCRGLQWRYGLVFASCDARNTPVKVLQVLQVPVDLDLRPASGGQASIGAAQVGSTDKRSADNATSDAQTPSGQQPEQATARGGEENARENGHVEADGAAGTDARDQAQWGLRHAAELGEVVRWCAPRIAWELLRLQLKVLGISYTEEVCLAELPAAACALMANGQVPLKAKTSAATAASGALQKCLRLHGLHSLKLLDHTNGVSGPTGVLLRVFPDLQLGQSAWSVTVQSAYFGGLPASCAACSVQADADCGAQHISQTMHGLTLAYSFATGGTVERATGDLRRLIRLHLALARIAALMRAAAGTDSAALGDFQPSTNSSDKTAPSQRHDALANGNVAKHSPGISAPAQACNSSIDSKTGIASTAGHDSRFASLTWQAQQGSGVVSVSAVSADRAVLLITAPTDVAEASGNRTVVADGVSDAVPKQHSSLPQLRVTMEWVAVKGSSAARSSAGAEFGGGRMTAQEAGSNGIRCRMSSAPALLAPVLQAFADMADAGEEELLLDALSLCGCALATLAAELAPEALRNAGLLPEEVSMDAAVAPYKLRLCISQAPDAQLTVGMHLLASGLIWLAPSASQEHVRADLVDRLSRLPEAFLPDAPETAASDQESGESKRRGPQTAPSVLDSAMEIDGVASPPLEAPAGRSPAAAGLWVRVKTLPAALRMVLKVAAEMA